MKFSAWLSKISPLADRLQADWRKTLAEDFVGGTVVAVMLVPQAMAYAMLAGLPPQVGLYASIAPVLLYALFGSSNCLAVGPVAMVSLLVFSGVGVLAEPGSAQFVSLCLTLAAMAGAMQILMAIFRFGFLMNFISHPVLRGFTSGAAIVIAFSQFKHLFGIEVDRSEHPYEMAIAAIRGLPMANWTTLTIGVGSVIVLLTAARAVALALKGMRASRKFVEIVPRFVPLLVVVAATIVVAGFDLHQKMGVAIVGEIPAGLPGISLPVFSLASVVSLFPLALVVALVGFLESYSVAKTLASRRREKVEPNRELFALGIADIGAAFTGGFPVTGGFSRSAVAQSAGVRTALGSIITALLVGMSVVLLFDLFFSIPRATLAAIIVVAVGSLINFRIPLELWKYSRPDALAWMVTFLAVLLVSIEAGILTGICATAILLMWRVSRPFVTQVGRIPGSANFRNVDRFDVDLSSAVVAFRVDASLIFANAPFVEDYVLQLVRQHPEAKSILLVASGINDIDATGIELIQSIGRELSEIGVEFLLSDVKGPVADRLTNAGFDEEFFEKHVFLSADEAMLRQGPELPAKP